MRSEVQFFFTGVSTNSSLVTLYKSDGTEEGTYALYTTNSIDLLTPSTTKLYFRATGSTGNAPYVYDGTSISVRPIAATYIYDSTPSGFAASNDKLFFISNGLWVSDGTQANTKRLFTSSDVNAPIGPKNLIEFQGKIFFFSVYYEYPIMFKTALFESDGTKIGTKIVKDFPPSVDLTSSYLLFLEKSSNRLYFRAGHSMTYGSQYFDLWTSDGTTAGTFQLVTVNHLTPVELKFNSVNEQFYMFLKKNNISNDLSILTSNGTVEGTKTILTKSIPTVQSIGTGLNNKLYFSIYDAQLGSELWASNGTNEGTYMVKDQRVGSKSLFPNTFMNFTNKLVFGAYDDTHGNEFWQYLPENCEGNRNYSIQSGSWSDTSTWSCGRLPSIDDYVIIKNPHAITIPNSYRTTIKQISTETGAVLNAPNSSIISIRPN